MDLTFDYYLHLEFNLEHEFTMPSSVIPEVVVGPEPRDMCTTPNDVDCPEAPNQTFICLGLQRASLSDSCDT